MAPDELTVQVGHELIDSNAGGPRELGIDPASGGTVEVRNGRFDSYVALVPLETDGGSSEMKSKKTTVPKPKMASLFKTMSPESITLDDALKLLSLPRTVGVYEEANTETGELGEVTVEANNFGTAFYLTKTGADGKSETRSLASEDEIFTVDVDKAKELFAQPKYGRGSGRGTAKPPLRARPDPETGKNVTIKDGFYGAYITDGETNRMCPSSTLLSPSSLTEAFRLLAEKRAAGPSKRGRRKTTGAAAKKTAAKKSSTASATKKTATAKKTYYQEDHGQEDRSEEDRRVESRRSRRDGGLAASHAAIAYTVGKGGVDMTGLFISFEGVDGVGKTTQVERLRDYLEAAGREVVVTREPGGTALGGSLRQLLLREPGDAAEADGADIAPRAEALIFAADRAQHVAEVVCPALERGAVVITDRYLDSSLAYQAGGRELTADDVRGLSMWATGGLMPVRTYLLDMDRRRRTGVCSMTRIAWSPRATNSSSAPGRRSSIWQATSRAVSA